MLKAGSEAPDFLVNDHNGNRVTLKEFRGKKIILWFYPKADTPGCTMEGKGFRDDYEKFQEKGTVILGVSLRPLAFRRDSSSNAIVFASASFA